jgi:hypothetical protein
LLSIKYQNKGINQQLVVQFGNPTIYDPQSPVLNVDHSLIRRRTCSISCRGICVSPHFSSSTEPMVVAVSCELCIQPDNITGSDSSPVALLAGKISQASLFSCGKMSCGLQTDISFMLSGLLGSSMNILRTLVLTICKTQTSLGCRRLQRYTHR